MANKDYLDHSLYADIKRENKMKEYTVYCKHCGHSIPMATIERCICTHCGYWVYRDDKIEFKYKMMENLKKNGKR